MIEIRVFDQDGSRSGEWLDVSEGDSIQLNFSVAEIQDISKRNSSFSEAFRLPMSRKNNKFFKSAFDVNISGGDFDVYAKTRAIIYEDTIPLLDGYLKINSINQLTEEYDVNIFGDFANIARELGDKDLSELNHATLDDLAGLNHTLSAANIIDGWAGNTAYSVSGTGFDGSEIMYPINDYGFGFRLDGSRDAIDQVERGIPPKGLRPAVKVKTIWDMIFSHAGYKYESSFIATGTAFDNIYMQCSGHNKNGVSVTVFKGFKAKQSVTQTVSSSVLGTGGFYKMLFNTESYDGDNKYDTSNQVWEVPGSGEWEITVELYMYWSRHNGLVADPSGVSSVQVGLYNVTTSKIVERKGVPMRDMHTFPHGFTKPPRTLLPPTETSKISKFKFNTNVDNVSVGDEIAVYLFYNLQSNVKFQILKENSNSDPSNWRTTKIPLAGSSGGITMEDEIPPIKQLDFVKGIVSKFNLMITPDKTDSKQLRIEPFNDWALSGSTLDWSNKLDISKEVTIKPLHEFQKADILFEDALDNDKLNKDYQDQFGKRYGVAEFKTDKPFANGELKITTPFSPYLTTVIPGTADVLHAPLYDLDEQGTPKKIAHKPKLFFYHGTYSISSGYNFIEDGSPAVITTTRSWPFCTHYENHRSTDGDIDLSWGYSSPYSRDATVTTLTKENAYNKFWAKYINQMYNKDARMLVGNFKLTAKDINELDFRDKIWVRDAMYRLNKASGYTVGKDSLTRCELIKVIDIGVFDCSVVPDTMNEDGTISFIDPTDGGAATPNRRCCNDAGFVFLDDECWWREPGSPTMNAPVDSILQDSNLNTGYGNNLQGGGNFAMDARASSATGSDNTIGSGSKNTIIQGDSNTAGLDTSNSLAVGESNLIGSTTERADISNVAVFGKNAHAIREGEFVHGWGTTSDRSQYSRMLLFEDIATSTSGWTQIHPAQDTDKHITMDEGSGISVVLNAVAYDEVGNVATGIIYHSAFRRATGGSVTMVSGSTINAEADGALAALQVRTSADTTNEAIAVEVNTGAYAAVTSWHITVELFEYREYV